MGVLEAATDYKGQRSLPRDFSIELKQGSITDFGEAIWWSFVTVTTVGYGDLSPVTWQGRCIAIGLMITGVALIGIVTATLASWIVDRVRDETDKRADEAESETEQLRHNVRELTDTVNQLRDDIAQLHRL